VWRAAPGCVICRFWALFGGELVNLVAMSPFDAGRHGFKESN
jgi:hypothetical protein